MFDLLMNFIQILFVIIFFDLSSVIAVDYAVTLKATRCQQNCDQSSYDDGKSCPSSITVNNKEMSPQKDGFNVMNLETMETSYFRWFNAAQRTHFDKFKNFFLDIERNSVVIIVFQNMCGSFDKDWYQKLSDEANISMDVHGKQSSYNMAAVVGCKFNCYRGGIMHSYFASNEQEYNITLTLPSNYQSSVKANDHTVLVVILVIILFIIIFVLLFFLYKKRHKIKSERNSNVTQVRHSELSKKYDVQVQPPEVSKKYDDYHSEPSKKHDDKIYDDDIDDVYVDPTIIKGCETEGKQKYATDEYVDMNEGNTNYEIPSTNYEVPSSVPKYSPLVKTHTDNDEYEDMSVYDKTRNTAGEGDDTYEDMSASAYKPLLSKHKRNEALYDQPYQEDDAYEDMDAYNRERNI